MNHITLYCDYCGWEGQIKDVLKLDGEEFCPACEEWEGLGEVDIVDDGFDFEYDDRSMFYHPGGNSALRAGTRNQPCPTCGRENALTTKDKSLGYQCDRCADAAEGIGMGY